MEDQITNANQQLSEEINSNRRKQNTCFPPLLTLGSFSGVWWEKWLLITPAVPSGRCQELQWTAFYFPSSLKSFFWRWLLALWLTRWLWGWIWHIDGYESNLIYRLLSTLSQDWNAFWQCLPLSQKWRRLSPYIWHLFSHGYVSRPVRWSVNMCSVSLFIYLVLVCLFFTF